MMQLLGVQVTYLAFFIIGLNCDNVFKCMAFSNSIKCPCGIKFCSKCREEKHHPIPCDILKRVLEYQ